MRTLFDPPSPPQKLKADFASRYTPRPYQLDARNNTFRLFDEGVQGVLVRMFTGAGKTFVGSWSAQEWNARGPEYRTIVFAHERQLVDQFAAEISDLLGQRVGIEMAERSVRMGRWDSPRIVVASRQTLMESADGNSRLFKFDPQLNWLQIFDECHRWSYKLKSCRHIIDWFGQNPESRRIGLTATPQRSDGVTFTRLFPGVALDYRMYDLDGGPSAVNDGWAVPYDQRFVEVAGVDFSNIREVAGDFSDDDLDEILRQKEQLDSMVKPMLDLVGNRRTLIFNPGVPMSRAVSEAINAERKYRIENSLPCEFGLADALDGSADEVQRKRVFEAHQRGEIQFLSVCGLCREGYNDRGIGAVAIFRPTKSQSLAEQMKGRGCRPLAGVVDGLATAAERKAAIAASGKPNCMVIDLVGATGLGDVASTAQLMATGKPDEVIKRANHAAVEQQHEHPDEPIDLLELIQRAEEQIEEEKRQAAEKKANEEAKEAERLAKLEAQRQAERQSRIRTEVRYSQQHVQPGEYTPERSGNKREGVMPFGKFAGKRIHDLPQWYLAWGINNLTGSALTQQFQAVVDARAGRHTQQADGPANENQRKVLQRHGYDADVTFAEAANIIKNVINPQLTGAR